MSVPRSPFAVEIRGTQKAIGYWLLVIGIVPSPRMDDQAEKGHSAAGLGPAYTVAKLITLPLLRQPGEEHQSGPQEL